MAIQALLVILAVLLVLLFLGVPISYAIAVSSLTAILSSIDLNVAVLTAAQRTFVGMSKFSLTAIPFFILAGNIMNQGGIAKRLVDFVMAILGKMPGALLVTNIGTNALFGAISGSASAAAAAVRGALRGAVQPAAQRRTCRSRAPECSLDVLHRACCTLVHGAGAADARPYRAVRRVRGVGSRGVDARHVPADGLRRLGCGDGHSARALPRAGRRMAGDARGAGVYQRGVPCGAGDPSQPARLPDAAARGAGDRPNFAL